MGQECKTVTLVERLEALTEQSREADAAIQNAAIGWHKWATLTPWIAGDDGLPAYTSSLDAALTLVPEGFSHGYKMLPYYNTKAECGTHEAIGATPAIALTIAALKARGVK